jgi:exosome complex component RRP4
VDVILGLNGLVWVAAGTGEDRREGGEGFDAEGVYSDKNDVSGSVVGMWACGPVINPSIVVCSLLLPSFPVSCFLFPVPCFPGTVFLSPIILF